MLDGTAKYESEHRNDVEEHYKARGIILWPCYPGMGCGQPAPPAAWDHAIQPKHSPQALLHLLHPCHVALALLSAP